MKIQLPIVVSLLIVNLVSSGVALASTSLCPKMAGIFTCRVENNGAPRLWTMVVTQVINDEYSLHEFFHYNDGPDHKPHHLTQKSSDEGQVNQNPFNPNSQYISKCAGDRINNYFGGRQEPSGGDRLNENGDWISFGYKKDGTEKVGVICVKSP
jgi:hypothetical protein